MWWGDMKKKTLGEVGGDWQTKRAGGRSVEDLIL